MKMSKTILPALAMLIVSAVMLSTASFAWFAMSTEVSATNMKVSITSDATNLVIANTAAEITGNSAYSTINFDFAEDAVKALLPVATDITGDTVSADFAVDNKIWYTQTSNKADVSDSNDGTMSKKTWAAVKASYALYKEFYVGVSAGSNDMQNLQAKVTIANADADSQASLAPVRVLVVSTDTKGYQTFTTSTADYTGAVTLASSITSESPVKVEIYVYYDGNHDDVTSKNLAAAAIASAKVSVYFTATKVTPAQGT